ncbi:hypothetical protein HBI38_123540 [Parastagonospora nodorum]|nr:hypothetical protein HBI73_197880 [Parastagonospora nodorum]KAH5157955.1 hypothetical protein HBH69_073950 [Parastagonospora nodorum]KAH6257722.1 hypothetical protein HBI41_156990 [Parastagonospora nodorum]KAH6318975.1 hypothetical protein HBI38_123540 [Parastagonospora nodorum]
MKRGLDGSEQDLDAILKSLTKAPDHQYGSSALPILSVITYVLGHFVLYRRICRPWISEKHLIISYYCVYRVA